MTAKYKSGELVQLAFDKWVVEGEPDAKKGRIFYRLRRGYETATVWETSISCAVGDSEERNRPRPDADPEGWAEALRRQLRVKGSPSTASDADKLRWLADMFDAQDLITGEVGATSIQDDLRRIADGLPTTVSWSDLPARPPADPFVAANHDHPVPLTEANVGQVRDGSHVRGGSTTYEVSGGALWMPGRVGGDNLKMGSLDHLTRGIWRGGWAVVWPGGDDA